MSCENLTLPALVNLTLLLLTVGVTGIVYPLVSLTMKSSPFKLPETVTSLLKVMSKLPATAAMLEKVFALYLKFKLLTTGTLTLGNK